MNDITVNKSDLIERIKANRAEHRAIFLAAQEKYRAKVIELLDARLADARNGAPIKLTFGLPEPADYTDEYTAALKALEWEISDTVTLDEESFRRLVLNEWRWAGHFAANTASYVAS
jgi:hypothetical protein